MGDIIDFKKSSRIVDLKTLTYNPNELIDVSEADDLVSWDIDAMTVEELRYNLRCMILIDRNQTMLSMREKGRLMQKIIKLEKELGL